MVQKIIILTGAMVLCHPSFAQANRYLQIGIDAFSQKQVYLDQVSVQKIGATTYKYTLSSESQELDSGKTGRFEEDIMVDCSQIGSIVHLGSRLYDEEGRLIKSDRISRTQDISALRSMPYLTGNQRICSKQTIAEP